MLNVFLIASKSQRPPPMVEVFDLKSRTPDLTIALFNNLRPTARQRVAPAFLSATNPEKLAKTTKCELNDRI